jgi:hypothetical protein
MLNSDPLFIANSIAYMYKFIIILYVYIILY